MTAPISRSYKKKVVPLQIEMKKTRHIITLAIAAATALLLAACGKSVDITGYSVIPEPEYMVQKGRTFTLSSSTRLCFQNLGRNTATAKYIATSLRKMHVRPAYISSPTKDCILFALNDTVNPELGSEGYLLQIRPEGIYISANSETGLFYAFQTFVQMLPPDITHTTYRRITLPECTVLDQPHYPWRGSLLDVCRHFLPVNDIKRHLDLMAAYKLNKFVWYLGGDHGWRIESEHFPALNDVGSWRVNRDNYPWGAAPPPSPSEEPAYGGYYSHDEIASVVEYAAQRHIEIIPAIELPGHCGAMLAAYPSLSCTKQPHSVAIGPIWPPDALLCAGSDSTLLFLNTLVDELAALFPSEYIHIGCTTPWFDAWDKCPRCSARKQQLGLGSNEALASWLIARIAEHAAACGKRIIAWDDLLDFGTPPQETVIAAWRGPDATALALRLAAGVVAAPADYCSFDTYQADTTLQPAAFPGLLTLQRSYHFDPLPNATPSAVRPTLWGGLCLLWTDYIHNYRQAEYMLLPRLCAFAESLWTPPEGKDWNRFRNNIEYHKKRLTAEGYNCCPGSFKPIVTKTPDGDGVLVTINTEVADTYVYYTTDGSDPTPDSPLYTTPLHLPSGTLLRTLSLYHGAPQENIYDYRL